MKVDFHIHTNASPDSPTLPEKLAIKARKLGIVPSITDHYTMNAIPAMEKTGIEFIRGEELLVSTKTGKADLIGLFLNEPIAKGTDASEAMDMIKSQGALIYAPHPFDSARAGIREPSLLKRVDIIEAFNPHSPYAQNLLAEEFAKKEGKLIATGSDSHFLFEFGQTYTEIELEPDELEPKKLLRALKRKDTKLVCKSSSRARRVVHRAAALIIKPFI